MAGALELEEISCPFEHKPLWGFYGSYQQKCWMPLTVFHQRQRCYKNEDIFSGIIDLWSMEVNFTTIFLMKMFTLVPEMKDNLGKQIKFEETN